MSTTIDDRVVEMRFDNKDFEHNVGQTLSTLDKLKLALNLPGATKGLQDVSNAAAKCDLSPLSNAVDNVGRKFSALDVIAFTALQRITNNVMAAGEKIIRQFTIEPISTGFNEYELKMGSVQTIMASTGASIDTVNKYLEELNKYSDQTIYSFSDMTNNIGKFTNAGVKLEDAVAAIKGISNEAAVSGANANEASRAMYNFAQALSAGYVKLIDWKSIENANMATVEFKNELLKTAEAVGTVTKGADGMYQVLTTNAAGGEMSEVIDATHSFNESLAFQWMTTDVLTQTLARYADETTDLGKKAFAAAQDVKTFSMMMDTLKEAAQSGWSATWEIIVGDFEEAKELFTGLSELFSGVIETFDNARNSLLRGGLSSSWKQLTDQITDAGVGMNDFEDALSKVVNGHGGDYTQLILDNKNLSKAIQNGVVPAEYLAEAFHKIAEGAAEAKDEETEQALYTKEQVQAIKDLDSAMGDANSSAGTLLSTLTQESGREYLFEILTNSLKGVIKLTSTFAKAWRDIIPPVLTSERLYKGLKFVGEFSRRLILSDENADKLRRTLHGLFVPIDLIGRVIGGVGSMIFRVLRGALGLTEHINFNILDYTANLGDALTRFHDWVVDSGKLGEYLGKVERVLSDGLSTVKGYIRAFLEIPAVKGAIDGIKSSISGFVGNIDGNLMNAASSFVSFSKNVYHAIKDYIDAIKSAPKVQAAFTALKGGLKNFINGIPDGFRDAVERIKTFVETVRGMDGITLDNIKAAIKLFGKSASEWLTSASGPLERLGTLFSDFAKAVNGKASTVESKLGSFIKTIKNLAIAVKDFVVEHKGALIAIAASGGLIYFVSKIGKALTRLTKPLFDISGLIDNLGGSINLVAKGMNKKLKSEAIKNYAISIAILAGSLYLISKIPSEDLLRSVITIGVLAGVLVALAFAMKLLNKGGEGGAKSLASNSGFLAIAGSLLILIEALKGLDSLEHPENLKRNLLYLGAMALGLVVVLKILSSGKGTLEDSKNTLNALQILAITGALKLLISSLDKIGQYDLLTIIKSLGLMLTAAIAMRILLATLRHVDPKAGLAALGAVVSLLLLVKAFKVIAALDVSKARKNLGAFIVIFGMYAILMGLSKLAGENALKGGVGILAMVSSLILLAIAIRMLAGLSATELAKGTTVITTVLGMFAVILLASFWAGEYAARAGVMILAISASLLLLTGAILILSEIGKHNPRGLDRAIKAIKKLLEGYALLIAASSFAASNGNAVKAITIMTAAIGILAIAIAGLSMIPPEQLKAAVKALSTVMIIFAMMEVLSRFSGGNIKSLIVLVAALGVITVALLMLKDVDPTTSLANATSISEVLLALAFSFKIIGSTELSKGVIKDLGIMLLALGAVAAILGVLAYFDVQPSITTATALSELLLALAVSFRVVSGAGEFKGNVLKTLGIMFAMLGMVALILGALAYLDIQPSITTATALSELLIALSAACLIVAIAGRVAGKPAAVAAGERLIAMVAVIGGIMLAVAGIVSYIPGARDFIANGIDVLEQLAEGLNRILTALLLGKQKETASLSDVAADLSGFMASLQPFIAGIKALDSSILDNAGTLVGLIATIAGAEMLANLQNVPVIGKLFSTGSLSTLGEDLVAFSGPLIQFIKDFRAAEITQDDIDSVSNAAQCVTELAKSIPNTGGALGAIVGNNDLGPFGDQIAYFGPKLKEFLDSVKGITPEDAEAAASAGTAVAEFAKVVPNTGGALGAIVGNNDLGPFGDQLVDFGPKLKKFLISVEGITPDAADSAVAAAKTVAAFAENVPNTGGAISVLLGDNSLTRFGSQLESFGPSFKNYLDSVEGIGPDAADSSTAAAETVAAFANIVPDSGGILSDIFGGGSPLTKFGYDLMTFGTRFKNYYENVKDITPGPINTCMNAVKTILSIGHDDVPDSEVFTALFKTFGSMGENMHNFYANIKKVDPTKLDSVVSLVETLVRIAPKAKDIDPKVFSKISDSVKVLGEADFSKLRDTMSKAGTDMIEGFTEGFSGKSLNVGKEFTKIISGLATSANRYKSSLKAAGVGLITAFLSGVKANTKQFSTIMSTQVSSTLNDIRGYDRKFRLAGQVLADNLKDGMESISLTNMFGSSISAAVNDIRDRKTDFYNAGKYLVEGFKNGISDYTYLARNAATALGKKTANSLKVAVEEKSPSKLTYQYGMYFTQGFANGITEYSNVALGASEKLGDESVKALSNTLGTLGDMVDNGLDVDPTIRPVLDLSNVQAGLGQIDGMINADRSIRLGYSGIITGRLSDTTNAISQKEQLTVLRRISTMMDTYFPQFSENDIYLDTGAIAGSVNRKLGLQH